MVTIAIWRGLLKRRKMACLNSGHRLDDHFVDVTEMIAIGSGDEDTRDHFLGKRPAGATTDSEVDLGMIVRDIDELMVLNDEAHHIHDQRMAWLQSIEDVHNSPKQPIICLNNGGTPHRS